MSAEKWTGNMADFESAAQRCPFLASLGESAMADIRAELEAATQQGTVVAEQHAAEARDTQATRTEHVRERPEPTSRTTEQDPKLSRAARLAQIPLVETVQTDVPVRTTRAIETPFDKPVEAVQATEPQTARAPKAPVEQRSPAPEAVVTQPQPEVRAPRPVEPAAEQVVRLAEPVRPLRGLFSSEQEKVVQQQAAEAHQAEQPPAPKPAASSSTRAARKQTSKHTVDSVTTETEAETAPEQPTVWAVMDTAPQEPEPAAESATEAPPKPRTIAQLLAPPRPKAPAKHAAKRSTGAPVQYAATQSRPAAEAETAPAPVAEQKPAFREQLTAVVHQVAEPERRAEATVLVAKVYELAELSVSHEADVQIPEAVRVDHAAELDRVVEQLLRTLERTDPAVEQVKRLVHLVREEIKTIQPDQIGAFIDKSMREELTGVATGPAAISFRELLHRLLGSVVVPRLVTSTSRESLALAA